MRARKDEDNLISIRQQNLLIFTLRPRIEPHQSLLPSFDLFDDPAFIRQNRDPHAVAQRGDIPFGFALFQLPAQLTNDKALPGFHCEETRLGPDDQTMVS